MKRDEQVTEIISIFPFPYGTLQYEMVWNLLGFLYCFFTPGRASSPFSLITAFLHDLGLSFCCIIFGRTGHVTCYGTRPCTCLLWFPRPAVARLLLPQTSSGMRKDRREVWTNQTNGGSLICIAGLSSSIMKSFLLSLMVREAIVSPFRWRIACSAWMLHEVP